MNALDLNISEVRTFELLCKDLCRVFVDARSTPLAMQFCRALFQLPLLGTGYIQKSVRATSAMPAAVVGACDDRAVVGLPLRAVVARSAATLSGDAAAPA